MVAVVAIHLAARIPQGDALYGVGRYIDHLCRFGVPLFLAAAGLRLAEKAPEVGDWPAWLHKRMRAVLPAYLLWAVLYGLVAPLDGQGQALLAGELPWPARLLSVLFGYGAEQLYFMTAYLGLLLLAPLVGMVLQKLGPAAIGALAVLLAAMGLLALNGWLFAQCAALVQAHAPLRGVAGWLLQTEARTPLHWFGFYFCGVALGQMRVSGLVWPPFVRWMAWPALVAHGWLALRPPSLQFDDFWCSPALVLSSCTFALWGPPLARRIQDGRVGRGMQGLGRASLAVYLSHVLFVRLAWMIVQRWPMPLALGLTATVTAFGVIAYLPVHRRVFGGAG